MRVDRLTALLMLGGELEGLHDEKWDRAQTQCHEDPHGFLVVTITREQIVDLLRRMLKKEIKDGADMDGLDGMIFGWIRMHHATRGPLPDPLPERLECVSFGSDKTEFRFDGIRMPWSKRLMAGGIVTPGKGGTR